MRSASPRSCARAGTARWRSRAWTRRPCACCWLPAPSSAPSARPSPTRSAACLKTFGLRIARGSGGLFAPRVREAAKGNDALLAIVDPMLLAWQALREQAAILDRQILARAKDDATARRLTTVPGVGVVVAL